MVTGEKGSRFAWIYNYAYTYTFTHTYSVVCGLRLWRAIMYSCSYIYRFDYLFLCSHNTAIVMELQDTVAELRRELAQLKEQAEAREQEQVVSHRLIRGLIL